MARLQIKPASACRFDQVSLGEVMIRLDPGDGRIRTAREFRVWEGGGEYNVARGLRRCFGLRTALVSAFADNEVGRLLDDDWRDPGDKPRGSTDDGGDAVRDGAGVVAFLVQLHVQHGVRRTGRSGNVHAIEAPLVGEC